MILSMSLVACTKTTDAETNSPAPQKTDGTTQKEQDNGDAEELTDKSVYELPFTDGATLVIGGRDTWYSETSYADNLEVWSEVEKRTGIKLEWEVYPGNQWVDTYRTRLASGQDLPDIMQIPKDLNDAMGYAKDELFVPLSGLINDYAPNMVSFLEKYPSIKQGFTAPDGEIYFFTGYREKYANGPMFILRKDWLDKVNMDFPETADDWYKVLKAFKNTDMNGNGKLDAIPMGQGVEYMGSAFGIYSPVTDRYFYEDGKAVYFAAQPGYKDYLEYVKKLYDEGLIYPSYPLTSEDKTKVKELRNQDKVGVVNAWPGDADNSDNTMKALGIENVDNICVLPPVGPDGKRRFLVPGINSSEVFGITKDCEDQELAIKFIDYIWANPEGVRLTQCGLEGRDYTINDDGVLEFTDQAMNNPDMNIILYLRTMGAFETFPAIQSAELNNARFTQKFKAGVDLVNSSEDNYDRKLSIVPTIEEIRTVQTTKADLDAFIDEETAKFILGRRDLSEFDDFVKELNNFGLEDLLKVYQQQYDRYSSNQ
jgi:putative aldouronate transport system substrate-binding protein